ncbi:MAG: hypothetical protein RR597_03120, partial [Christensenella sp.]
MIAAIIILIIAILGIAASFFVSKQTPQYRVSIILTTLIGCVFALFLYLNILSFLNFNMLITVVIVGIAALIGIYFIANLCVRAYLNKCKNRQTLQQQNLNETDAKNTETDLLAQKKVREKKQKEKKKFVHTAGETREQRKQAREEAESQKAAAVDELPVESIVSSYSAASEYKDVEPMQTTKQKLSHMSEENIEIAMDFTTVDEYADDKEELIKEREPKEIFAVLEHDDEKAANNDEVNEEARLAEEIRAELDIAKEKRMRDAEEARKAEEV